MRILALDLGTKTGVAHNLNNGHVQADTWVLATPKEIREWGRSRLTRRADPRIRRLFDNLFTCRERKSCPDLVVFEDVLFQSYTFQCQLWSSLRAMIWAVFDGKTHLDCVPTSTLKKFATGHGGATKEMMAASLRQLHPTLYKGEFTHDEVDALWVWLWAEKTYARSGL